MACDIQEFRLDDLVVPSGLELYDSPLGTPMDLPIQIVRTMISQDYSAKASAQHGEAKYMHLLE